MERYTRMVSLHINNHAETYAQIKENATTMTKPDLANYIREQLEYLTDGLTGLARDLLVELIEEGINYDELASEFYDA